MKKANALTLFIFLFALPLLAFGAKKGYKITFVAEGNTDSVLYLGYHYAQHRYYCDTATAEGKGKFVFEGTKELYPGLYFITNGKDKYVELVVYHEEPRFKLTTDDANWKLRMSVKGSKQNEVFYNFNRANELLYQELEEAQSSLDSANFVLFRRNHIKRLDSLRYSFLEQYPDYMISRMMFATKDITVPTKHPDSTAMSDRERYDWFMHHYFDNVPLDDDFIVRTPKAVFYDRVMEYVDKHMNRMPPDMICPLLDSMIDRSEPAPEVFKWLVHTMTEHFLQSRVMVYDEVYCHLALRYYGSGKAFWSSPSVVDEIVERANKWEPLLVGKVAPGLILFDTLHRVHSLHHMPGNYTLLLFWSPTCGHCRDIIPAVYKVFEQYADSVDLSAFAILTEPDEQTVEKWKKFIADHQMTDPRWVHLNGGEANVDWRQVYDVTTTPQIYLIDNRDHKFVAKKLGADILNDVLRSLLDNNK